MRDAPGVAFARRHFEAMAIAVGTVLLAFRSLRGLLHRLGHPGGMLDDSYIHFQYARAIASGHPLRFQAGEPFSSGATSFAWPALLAPFWGIGFRGEAILWPAWFLSYASLGLLAFEVLRVTRPLTGRLLALTAAAMTLSFGGYAWAAPSGMEVVPFAWLLLRTARRAAEHVELRGRGEYRGRRSRAIELVALAVLAPLMRPEGTLASLTAAAALLLATTGDFLPPRRRVERLFALGALFAPALFPLLLRVTTGQFSAATANVKLLLGNPYYAGSRFFEATCANAKVLVGTLLEGSEWSAEFVPFGGAWAALSGLVALGVVGLREKKAFRAAAVLVVALGLFAPCAYVTFLWNRLRYLDPFAGAWFVGLACLARLLGDAAARLVPRGRVLGPLAGALVAGLFASKLPGVFDDIANCAEGIDHQQVTLGHWIDAHLPEGVRVGLNDTGAIAYFGNRKTFDIVGLTTPSEGRYWVAGTASRVEHYERVLRERGRDALPTHFAVYKEWFGSEALLGEELVSAHVEGPAATILGGQTMGVFVADYSLFGTGEAPWTRGGVRMDALDVADIDDERAHEFRLDGARDGEEIVTAGEAPSGLTVLDGGRTHRRRDRFAIRLPGRGRLVARVAAPAGAAAVSATLLVPGRSPIASAVSVSGAPSGATWTEIEWPLEGDGPAGPIEPATPIEPIEIEVDYGSPVATFHYWSEGAGPGAPLPRIIPPG